MEDNAMPRTSALRTALGVIAIVGIAASPVWAQGARPEGRPFDAGKMLMEQPAEAGVAVRAGRLFDSKAGTMLTNQVILIKGDRITDVGPAGRVQIPQGARVIDLSQATVLPGLIDRHVHCFAEGANQGQVALRGLNICLADLNGGFTTVQDMGSNDYSSVDVRDAINKGWVMGPRMQVAGPQINPRAANYYPSPSVVQPFGTGGIWQLNENVNSPWLARAAVREHSHYGTDWIKIYLTEDYEGSGYRGAFHPDGTMINVPSMTLEEVQAIVDEAHRRGLKTITHVRRRGVAHCASSGSGCSDACCGRRDWRQGAGRRDDQALQTTVGEWQTTTRHSDALGFDRPDGTGRSENVGRQDHSLQADGTELQAARGRGCEASVRAAACTGTRTARRGCSFPFM